MNFYLISTEEEDPIHHVAVGPEGALFGGAGGRLYFYDLDQSDPETVPLPRQYQSIGGLAMEDAGGQSAIVLGVLPGKKSDILRLHLPSRHAETLYPDAPYSFVSMSFDRAGREGLLLTAAEGWGEVLRYHAEQRSYQPVHGEEGLRFGGADHRPGAWDGPSLLAATRAGGAQLGLVDRDASGEETLRWLGSPREGCSFTDVAWDSRGESALVCGGRGLLIRYGGEDGTLTPLPQVSGSWDLHAVAHASGTTLFLIAGGSDPTRGEGSPLLALGEGEERPTRVYEAPPGAGDFLSVAVSPGGTRALVGCSWGGLLEADLTA